MEMTHVPQMISIKGGAWYCYNCGSWVDEIGESPEGSFKDTAARGICDHWKIKI